MAAWSHGSFGGASALREAGSTPNQWKIGAAPALRTRLRVRAGGVRPCRSSSTRASSRAPLGSILSSSFAARPMPPPLVGEGLFVRRLQLSGSKSLMIGVLRALDRFPDKLRDFARPWELAVFIWVPAIGLAYAFWWELRSSSRLQDFGIFRVAAQAVLDGRSPYPAATPLGVAHFDKFVYPPVTAFLFAPMAELPLVLAQVAMLVFGVVCIFAALRLLDVRDWRCYGIAAVSGPAVNSLALGAVTSFMVFGVAAAWRYRDRPGATGLLVAATAVGKLFLWPLGLWLLATRRLRATLVAVVTGIVLLIAGWAAIGFAGMRSYPHLLRVLSQVEEGTSYSPVALLHLSASSARLFTVVLAGLLIVTVALAARGADGDRRALAIAVIGSLLVTPIVWLHYFLLLLVPIALYRPRLSPLWFAPILLWLTPSTHSHGVTWHIALALAVTAVVAVRTTAGHWSDRVVEWTAAIPPWGVRRSISASS
jgi:alpha-1,2-mannosyltransferase